MKKIVLFLFLITLSFGAFAQVSVNPNDEFYSSAKNWQTKGILKTLPDLRPYPVKTIKLILNTVIENGSEKDVAKAKYYFEKYFGKAWNLGFELKDKNLLSDTNNNRTMLSVKPSVFGDADLFKYLTIGYDIGILVQNHNITEKDVIPTYTNVLNDTYDDPATFGSIVANLDMTTNVAIGTENLYAMVGVNRVGYGPFTYDGVALNSTAYHAGNFSFSYVNEKWSYSQLISAISSGFGYGENGTSDFRPNKFLAFHTIKFNPIKQLSIAYYESSVFGNRFDPSYIIPAPYMIIQGMFGQVDNTFSGLTIEYRPFNNFEYDLSANFDDIDVNSFAKGNMNSRLRAALQTGVTYTPNSTFCDVVSFDYTLVTPYMYSHSSAFSIKDSDSGDTNNYSNYTNRNICMGSSIAPNSDRFRFNIKFAPTPRFNLEVLTSFIRHANALESLSESEAQSFIDYNNLSPSKKYNSDGSVFSYPDYDSETCNLTNFMNQEHQMYIFQIGLNTTYEFQRKKYGVFSISAGYIFEYIHNKGVDSPIYSGAETNAAIAKQKWIDNLHDEFNNYFSISVKYCY